MYLPSRAQGLYGLGVVTYDADGLPVEDPANTTYGATSGGGCPGSPGCPGNVQPVPLTQSLSAWLNANAGKVAIGAGVFLALVLVKRR